jgi:hypothetical protein
MSRIAQVALNVTAANQYSPWLNHDYYGEPFNVNLGLYFGSGLSATLTVQYALDDLSLAAKRQCLMSQAANTITITDPGIPSPTAPAGGWGHGLATGDYCNILTAAPGTAGAVAGEYPTVTVLSATQYTVASAFSQTITDQLIEVVTARVLPHATLVTQTTRASGSYGFPVWGSRITSTAFTSGGVAYLLAMQGGRGS